MGRLLLVFWVMMMAVLGQLHGCIEKERVGLLELKAFLQSLTPDDPQDVDRILQSWSNDTKSDCCGWEGIKCDLSSGRIIGLSLYSVEISTSGTYPLNLSLFSSRAPLFNLSLLYPFQELQELNLSSNTFAGWFDDIQDSNSLRKFKKLKILDLSRNEFNNSILPFLNVTVPLKTLSLAYNHLNGPFPIEELKNMRSLKILDLSHNNFNRSLPEKDMANLNKLEALDLSDNDFSGSLVLQGICKLKNLKELDLSQNKFERQVPLCFGNMKKLRVLDLSSNQLSGKLQSYIFNNLKSLEYLSLSNNKFEGLFSFNSLTNLSRLKVFKLSSPSNSLRIETKSFWQPNLAAIELLYCNMEKIPNFLLRQKELRLVDLSGNKLSGQFPTWMLENNSALDALLLSNNSFSRFRLPRFTHNLRVLDVSTNNFRDFVPKSFGNVLPNIIHMNMSRNGFQGNLPSSLGEMRNVIFLDLSYNNFSGRLPRNFLMSCYWLKYLKISHNKFSGQIFPKTTNFTSLWVLYMDNNKFSGKLGDSLLTLRDLMVLDISNNSLSGTIPSWIGNLTFLTMVSMANNSLEGTIPISLFQIESLMVLDFSNNMLSGALPSYSKSYSVQLLQLYLSENELEGSIPTTLLENIMILDLRNNKLSGSIPQFSNAQNTIRVLLLRGNNLSGHVPKSLCHLSNIRLLDLADNKLNGSIPSCLNNTLFGSRSMDVDQLYYNINMSYDFYGLGTYYHFMLIDVQFYLDYKTILQVEINFAAKQRYDSYTGRPLGSMFGLDLSSNELNGEIPTELGDLQKLLTLNLSHNNLSGLIPESFSNMKSMESLDLSFNRLFGRIPPQFTELNYLSVFNVSYNNLSSIIPWEGQFSTLVESNYIGNPLLCGPPTNKSCNTNNSEVVEYGREDDGAAIDTVVFLWSFGSTYVTVMVGIMVFLCFDSSWRQAWFRCVDAFISLVKNMWS